MGLLGCKFGDLHWGVHACMGCMHTRENSDIRITATQVTQHDAGEVVLYLPSVTLRAGTYTCVCSCLRGWCPSCPVSAPKHACTN